MERFGELDLLHLSSRWFHKLDSSLIAFACVLLPETNMSYECSTQSLLLRIFIKWVSSALLFLCYVANGFCYLIATVIKIFRANLTEVGELMRVRVAVVFFVRFRCPKWISTFANLCQSSNIPCEEFRVCLAIKFSLNVFYTSDAYM